MMARKSATTETLERQAASDSQLGDMDESGVERLPSFDSLPAEHTNGSVRPSEQCRTPSPLGMGCTLEAYHVGGHSWQPGPHSFAPGDEDRTLCAMCASPASKSWHLDDEPESSEQASGQVVSDPQGTFPDQRASGAGPAPAESSDQPMLPGTPEPSIDEYSIPYESQFNGADFQGASGIKAIAEALIAQTEEFTHLRGIEIRYFWKRRGGLKGGNPRLGNLQRPSGLASYALGRPIFALWLAADHCREAKLTQALMEALVFSQLCKAAVDPDDHSAYRIVGPDVEMFALELSHYGLWSQDLREAAASLRQLPLDHELVLTDADDEGEDDEAEE